MLKIEIRNNEVKLDGYVNVVERESRILPSVRGKFIEKIKAKTFEKALAKTDDVKILFNHNEQRQLGSIKEGNLELFEDSIGLRAIATITDEEVVQKAVNKELRGWSFGFVSNKDVWSDGENDVQLRVLEDIDLLEVSILDKTPAYIATSIEVRDENEVVTEQRSTDFEAKVEVFDSMERVNTRDETEVVVHKDGEGNPYMVEKTHNYNVYAKTLEFLRLKNKQ